MFWIDRITVKAHKGRFDIETSSYETEREIRELEKDGFEIISVAYNVRFVNDS